MMLFFQTFFAQNPDLRPNQPLFSPCIMINKKVKSKMTVKKVAELFIKGDMN